MPFRFSAILAVCGGWAWVVQANSPLVSVTIEQSSVEIAPSVRTNALAELRVAAAELTKHLELVCGNALRGGGVRFVLGAPPEGARAVGNSQSFGLVRNGCVYLWGDDAGSGRNSHHGTLFAVYEFLDRALGVRWVRPGEGGVVFERRRTVSLRDGWQFRYRPPLLLTVLRSCGAGDDYNAWLLCNRVRKRKSIPYRHSFGEWQKRFLDTHPEFLGLSPSGRRGLPTALANRIKLCVSNEAVVDQIVEDWKAAGTNAFLNISPNDGSIGFCHCERCCALDATRPGEDFLKHKTDRYVNFWNRVTAKALAIRPDATVVSYIYSYYRHPPRRERLAYPDHQFFGYVPTLTDDYRASFKAWKKAGLKRFLLRPNYLCYTGTEPRGLERYLYENFQYFRREGAIGVDYDGRPTPATAFERYVLARVVTHPDLPFETIAGEWYASFGAESNAVRSVCEKTRVHGEATLARTAAELKKNDIEILDDTVLSKYFSPTLARQAARPRPLKPDRGRTSFDVPGLEGWTRRAGFSRITFREAFFDRYSAEFVSDGPDTIALSRGDVPVEPGARYRVCFAAKFGPDVERLGVKTKVFAPEIRTLGGRCLRKPSPRWQEASYEFTAPADATNVAMCVVFSAPPGTKAWFDDVTCEKLPSVQKESLHAEAQRMKETR